MTMEAALRLLGEFMRASHDVIMLYSRIGVSPKDLEVAKLRTDELGVQIIAAMTKDSDGNST